MITKNYLLIPMATLLFGILQAQEDSQLMQKAQKLAKDILIVDTHIDVPYRLNEKMEDISVRTPGGEFDYERAYAGGLNAAFMSIYIPAEYQKKGGAKVFADSLIDMVEKFEKDHPGKFKVARSTKDVSSVMGTKKIALPMGMENGAPLEGKLENLRHFYDRGIRYITLTHSKDNDICDSSYDTTYTWKGLSPFGENVVTEMNRLGIMVDISHVSDSAFYDVMKITHVPAIASHSACRHFTPGFERNMNDDMIKLLAKKGGVIQIPFSSLFISGKYNKTFYEVKKKNAEWCKANNIPAGDKRSEEHLEQLMKETGVQAASIGEVADHLDHIVKIAGIDHAGLGSDYDGARAMPEKLKDVSHFPNLIYELLKRGYSEKDIRKICGENLMRVWREVEKVAVK